MKKKANKEQFDFKPFESTCIKPKHYLRIADNMMASKAWIDISCFAKVAYLYMKDKFNFTNEDDISLTYKEVKELKLMDKARYTKSLDELIEHGFIRIKRQGILNVCTKFELINEWQYFDTNALKVKSRVKHKSKKEYVKVEVLNTD